MRISGTFLLAVSSIARPRNNFLRVIYRSHKIASSMRQVVDSDTRHYDRFFFLHRLVTSREILRDCAFKEIILLKFLLFKKNDGINNKKSVLYLSYWVTLFSNNVYLNLYCRNNSSSNVLYRGCVICMYPFTLWNGPYDWYNIVFTVLSKRRWPSFA